MVRLLRWVYGLVLAAILFTPFGVYHSLSEPYITGYLWGYNLPIGYVGLASGLLAISYKKIDSLNKVDLGSIMIVIGVFLILTFPVSYTHLRAHETDSYLVCRLLL